jgi:probable rRNA maturation factor
LGRDRPTDVIAFPGDGDLLGEIACSVDTAARQALSRGVPLINELTLLAVHGFLHLAGYDDLSLPKWRKMKIAEFETVIGLL